MREYDNTWAIFIPETREQLEAIRPYVPPDVLVIYPYEVQLRALTDKQTEREVLETITKRESLETIAKPESQTKKRKGATSMDKAKATLKMTKEKIIAALNRDNLTLCDIREIADTIDAIDDIAEFIEDYENGEVPSYEDGTPVQ